MRGEDREARLREDQYVGQLGELALHMVVLGVGPGRQAYTARRSIQDRQPYTGDNGYDMDAYPYDVKTSLMRRSHDPLTYTLIVRPREWHPSTIYVLALVDKGDHRTTVHLPGYARGDELAQGGRFGDAYTLPASSLHPVCHLVAPPSQNDPPW